MHIHDDADAETITRETIGALRECARMVGKIGPSFTVAQIEQMEEAMLRLQSMLNLKRGMADA